MGTARPHFLLEHLALEHERASRRDGIALGQAGMYLHNRIPGGSDRHVSPDPEIVRQPCENEVLPLIGEDRSSRDSYDVLRPVHSYRDVDELYHIELDPKQYANLAADADHRAILDKLKKLVIERAFIPKPSTKIDLDERTTKELRSLGYLD